MASPERAKRKKAKEAAKESVLVKDQKLLQVRLPKDLVTGFRILAMTKETTVRALLEELIRERLKREGFERV